MGLGKDTDGTDAAVASAELPRGLNLVQTRKPELTLLHFANRFLHVPANIAKIAGKTDASLVGRHPLAACTAVNDAGVGEKRSGGDGNERGMDNDELYLFLFFPKFVPSTFFFFFRTALNG